MAKKSKKALGAAMAGVMAVGAVSGAVNAATQVNVVSAATESQAVKNAKAKINHLIWSINNNYAGLKNQAQWEAYVKEAKALIAKIPAGEKAQADALTKQVAGISDTIMAIARINQVEKSYATNYKGIKNASQWREYLDLATEDLKSVDKSVFAAKYEELVERLNKASDDVAAIEEAHYAEIEKIEAKLEKAEKAGDVDALKELLEIDMKKLGSHESTDELRNKILDAIIAINDKAVISVKATNSTTVEVLFKDKLQNIKAEDFVIEGLEVKNAVIKQTDAKTAVVTTSAQEGGKEYAVKVKGEDAGKFTGISSVIPTSIKFDKTAINGIVGTQITLKADVGVKEAGIPVTFSVPSDDNNKAQEVLTDKNGIATFTYTNYATGASGYTNIYAYPTGAPAVRDLATVYWGVNNFFTVEEVTKGDVLDNNSAKTYKVVYLDRTTGKPVSGKALKVTLKENIDTQVDKRSTAKINGQDVVQYGDTNRAASITTNSKGEAVFTVTGANTKATPIVFVDSANGTANKLENGEERVEAPAVTFAAKQAEHVITVTRDGGEEAAAGDGKVKDAGRKYKVSAKTKDGKVAANEVITVALNEDIDGVLSTVSGASIYDYENNADSDKKFKGEFVSGSGDKIAYIKLDANGEAEFRVASISETDYATPIIWIDIANNGKLDKGEASAIGEKVYFVESKVAAGSLKVLDANNKDKTSFKGTEAARFKFVAANQSGQEVNGVILSSTYTVTNTGANKVVVNGDKEIEPNRSITVSGSQIEITSLNKTSSVSVTAYGEATLADGKKVYLGQQTATASFLSTNEVSDFYTGNIISIDTVNEKIIFDGKSEPVSYKDAKFTGVGGAPITKDGFELLLKSNKYTATYSKDADGKVKIDLIAISNEGPTSGSSTFTGVLTFTSNGKEINSIPAKDIKVEDKDLNNPLKVDTAKVTITDKNSNVTTVVLTETGADTGVFENAEAVDVSKLVDGDIVVKYVDDANASGISDTKTATAKLDRVAPAAPSITTIDGKSTPAISKTTTPEVVLGSVVSGDTIKIYDEKNVEIGSIEANATTAKVSTSDLSEGAHTLTAKAIDKAGNVSEASVAFEYTVDKTAPAVHESTPITVVAASSSYAKGDTITIKFSEKVDVSKITKDNLTISNSHKLGDNNVTVKPANEGATYADTFVITLGDSTDVAQNDTITITKTNVTDEAGNDASSNVVFTIPATGK